MRRWTKAGFLILTLALGPTLAGADTEHLNVYSYLIGGQETYQVEKGLHLSHLALRKGVRWQVLARHNQLKEPYRLKRGQILQINNTHIVPTETIHGLVINLPELALYHFQEGAFRRRYSLAVGRRTWPTPTGNYEIRNKARNPTWIVPASIQEEMAEAGKEVLERVPPGPDNPLGAFWLGTSAPGVGLHATNRPWSIGTSASHGCIRMLPDEIAELFPQVEVGTPLKIIYQPVKLAMVKDKIFLEVHPDIYLKKIDAQGVVETLAARYRLASRIDWDRTREIVKAKEGIAQEITLGAPRPQAVTAASEPSQVQPLGLSPLQPGGAKLE